MSQNVNPTSYYMSDIQYATTIFTMLVINITEKALTKMYQPVFKVDFGVRQEAVMSPYLLD